VYNVNLFLNWEQLAFVQLFRCVCKITKSVYYFIMSVCPPAWNYWVPTEQLLTFWSLAVSVCTTRFNIQKFYMALALCLVFVWISEQTATSALYTFIWLVFITIVESVYCVVWTDSLYTADYVSFFKRLIQFDICVFFENLLGKYKLH
jgi:hypothetical protein